MARPNQKIEASVEDGGGDDERRALPDGTDYDNYIADMILELQQMAARAGRHALAERLLAAHALARHR